ncbi:MAG: nicotinate (nicotinamide) nucleotide adenylyltransferase [Patescibacteria group bacterium]|nr:nicotinate (nicotinamide) nucleotide adenylyltransferase [Patescibacteria group bacterium]
MNITLFGGSFNPPHLGHQIVINQAFELIPNIDELWLLPDYTHAFSKNEKLISPQHRLTMAKILENHKIKTNTCTYDQKMPGNTILHITYLQKKFPQHQFSFLIGSDNLPTFNKWAQYKKLLKLMPFYVYPRTPHPFKPLYKNMYPLKHPLQIITNISSTTIRQRIKNKLSTKHLLPKKIADYIKTNQLYT